MPSPFPGMDPYLEAPDIWPDFHDSFAGWIRDVLNRTLPRPYYAKLAMRPEIGIAGDEDARQVVPDVAVVRFPNPSGQRHDPAVALLERPRTDLSPSVSVRVPDEPIRHHFVEVRDASRGRALVTLIEIVSPSNKRPGPDRRAYEAKQRDVLDSDTSLLEIDLLRRGDGIVGGPVVVEAAAHLQPRHEYLVGISRAWLRGAEYDYQLFPVRIEDTLPCIPVPLRKGEAEVPLDLQYVFNQAYDGGPYARGDVDYDAPPDPPLPPDMLDWAKSCLDRIRA